jgi:hypothetical protein
MNPEQLTIAYDDFFIKPRNERLDVLNEISAENRALLIKTHVERWRAANRLRLTSEQIAILEEMISFITPEKYQADRDMEKIHLEVEELERKAEAFFSREELRQIWTNSADYIPPIETEKS